MARSAYVYVLTTKRQETLKSPSAQGAVDISVTIDVPVVLGTFTVKYEAMNAARNIIFAVLMLSLDDDPQVIYDAADKAGFKLERFADGKLGEGVHVPWEFMP